ncbi:HD domain-containing protein [candidate division KSB1 bacterium]|nr:HD domain-containing protein [candidate division KSB1 bacterium]
MPPVTLDTTPSLARVRELPTGEKIIGFYLLTKLEVKPKKSGGNYLELRLQDSSGTLDAKKWEEFEEFAAVAKPGDVLKIEAVVDRYREIPGLVISRLRHATGDEAPDGSVFLPHSTLSETQAQQELFRHIESITRPDLRALLEAIFGDAGFLAAFLRAPGGKLWHHATIGGLAEHTISMCYLADALSTLYSDLNRDLLIAGAMLHDLGKAFELKTEIAIDYTVEGRLLGHITQGVLHVDRAISAIPEFPDELRRQLLHLILSHQGDGTMGSPVKPMTLEALVLHYCDELDSRINAFQGVRSHTPEGREFSDYVKLMERFFYFRSADEPKPDPDEQSPV